MAEQHAGGDANDDNAVQMLGEQTWQERDAAARAAAVETDVPTCDDDEEMTRSLGALARRELEKEGWRFDANEPETDNEMDDED